MQILMILIPDGDDVEPGAPMLRLDRFIGPYYVFRDADAELTLASPAGGFPWMGPASGDMAGATPARLRFQRDRAARDELNDTLGLDQVYADEFDGALCIGAPGPIWPPGHAGRAAALIAAFLAAGKPVALIPSPLDLAPQGAGEGLLIIGDGAQAPVQAAQALLGALRHRDRERTIP